MDVDDGGNVCVAGESIFSNIETYFNSLFVLKINESGDELGYVTYFWGDSHDYLYGLSVDKLGNAYLKGDTCSSRSLTVWIYEFFSEGGLRA